MYHPIPGHSLQEDISLHSPQRVRIAPCLGGLLSFLTGLRCIPREEDPGDSFSIVGLRPKHPCDNGFLCPGELIGRAKSAQLRHLFRKFFYRVTTHHASSLLHERFAKPCPLLLQFPRKRRKIVSLYPDKLITIQFRESLNVCRLFVRSYSVEESRKGVVLFAYEGRVSFCRVKQLKMQLQGNCQLIEKCAA